MKTVAGIAALMMTLVACGEPISDTRPGAGGKSPSPSADEVSDTSEYEGTWQLVSGSSPSGDIKIDDKYRITMTVEDRQIGGVAACNQYGAEVTIVGNDFTLGGASMNQMGCQPRVSEAESRYIDALLVADAIARNGETLTLTGPEVELVFEFVPPPPTASLVDTKWRLESLVHGKGDDGVASSTEPAWIRFDKDGSALGFTGCKDLTGEWHEAGDTIGFGYFGVEGDCPSELEEQHGAFLSLGDGFRFEIEGQTLTANPNHSDLYVVFRASGS